MQKSEVKALMEQITLSYQAAQRAHKDFSITAPHAFITKRMEEIEQARKTLISVTGDEAKATDLVAKALEEA